MVYYGFDVEMLVQIAEPLRHIGLELQSVEMNFAIIGNCIGSDESIVPELPGVCNSKDKQFLGYDFFSAQTDFYMERAEVQKSFKGQPDIGQKSTQPQIIE